MQSLAWDSDFNRWVVTDDRHPNIEGRGRSREEARADFWWRVDGQIEEMHYRQMQEAAKELEQDEKTPTMPWPFAKPSTW